MPIKPISGEIESQPLNGNFSYLDSEVSKANGQLPGQTSLTYANGLLTQIDTPDATTQLSYDGTRLIEVVEQQSARTVTTTLEYTDRELTGMNTEVIENE